MSMGDALDLHDYWSKYPPEHLILRAVHLNRDRSSAAPARESQATNWDSPAGPADEGETLQRMFEMQMLCGSALGPQQPMPQHIRELADYADEVMSKLHKRPN